MNRASYGIGGRNDTNISCACLGKGDLDNAKTPYEIQSLFLSEAELMETFVVRHADLDLIIGIISENDTDSNQHMLVIGPRGSGKTTLVHRLSAEIKQNKELRDRWYPLIFSEESYEVVSAGEFWLEALFHLSEQAGNKKWKQAYEELKNEIDDQRLRDAPWRNSWILPMIRARGFY